MLELNTRARQLSLPTSAVSWGQAEVYLDQVRAGAFAAMVATHAAVVFVPAVPFWVDIVVTVGALAAAFRFTAWYPGHARKKAADVVVQAGHE